MIEPQALGALAGTHELLMQLLESLPPRDCNRRFDGQLPSAGWLLGRAVYLELHLLRGVVMGDGDLASRVRHLFAADPATPETDAQLPPRDHLLGWAGEVFDQHLTWLANPGYLPTHPLLADSALVWHLAERQAMLYEQLLAVLGARNAQRERGDYQAAVPLVACLPRDDSSRIEQGHYRIGARDGIVMASEQPAQLVELHAFRISRHPVRNAEFLAFIDDRGYQDGRWWDDAGEAWRREAAVDAPWHWRRDPQGHWYGMGTSGPADLQAEDPVHGLCAHEARAYAAWAAARGEGLSGAVPQHEYQWELAARLGELDATGRVWEWCANVHHPYPGYQAPVDPGLEPCPPDTENIVLRGGCLHTQARLRRTTFRACAPPQQRTLFAGTRLVMPPGKAAWE